MFSFFKKLFGTDSSEKEKAENAMNWLKTSSIEDKLNYLQKVNCELFQWIKSNDIPEKKLNKIISIAVYNYVMKNITLPFLIKEASSLANVDSQLIKVEKLKLNEMSDIDWQLSFDAAKRK